ncbi:MAG: hypothetical protein WBC51_21725 [Vicinamibacterales bacterium]
MAKLRGTEAEIHARLRELTEEFRQLRRELSDTTQKRVSGKLSEQDRAAERPRPSRPPKGRQR